LQIKKHRYTLATLIIQKKINRLQRRLDSMKSKITEIDNQVAGKPVDLPSQPQPK
jgi:CII-binding regulator of phage lambda lysogenization HflD